MESNIDVVIPWVDGNDPEWQKEFIKYSPQLNNRDSNTVIRYRDWNNLQYLFRGIEVFMPWVRKVHLITCGQKPKWLNVDAPKLNFVQHEDFIPKEYLPTFSVRPIELNIHRIADLSEQFIYFNDDFFVLKPMKPTDFFRKGLPLDIAALNVLMVKSPRCIVMANNTLMINKHFNKKKVIRQNISKWLKLSYGRYLLKSLSLMQWGFFSGFQDSHLPQPYLKRTFEDVWIECEDVLKETTQHRFRDISDVNQSLMRYWQIVSGEFSPYNVFRYRKYYEIADDNIDSICKEISNPRKPLFILNDSDHIFQFEMCKDKLNAAFSEIFPHKSSFEL